MNTLRIEDVIKADWIEEYKRQRDVLYDQLIMFNTQFFTLERLEAFPITLFIPLYDDRIFWQTIKNSLVESTLLIAYRVTFDNDHDVLSLRRFHKNISENAKDEAAKQAILHRTDKLDFETRVANLQEKLRQVRNNYLAHVNKKLHLNPTPQHLKEIQITQSELRELLELVRQFFDALCFEHRHELWLMAYYGKQREDHQTDIDKLLDMVAKNSKLLHLPEKKPEVWQRRVQKLTDGELTILNQYRVKFGLPQVTR